MDKYKIILADDHEILRIGLKKLIEGEPLFEVVAEAFDGEDLVNKLKSFNCDLVLLDLSMPNMDGIEAIKIIHKKYPKIKIIVLTMQKDYEQFKKSIKNGAVGYILKGDAYEQLLLAIKIVLKGKKFISPSVSNFLADRYLRKLDDEENPSLEILSKREKEVLALIAKGFAGKNIAVALNISVRTVETHRSHLTDKLGIKNTAILTKYALSKGLI